MDRERLVELVLQAADEDWRLRERLLAEARAACGEGPELATWRRRVDAAFAPYDDFVSYREAAGWAGEVDEVIDALGELDEAGEGAAAVKARALAKLVQRVEQQPEADAGPAEAGLSGVLRRLNCWPASGGSPARPASRNGSPASWSGFVASTAARNLMKLIDQKGW